jgi:transcriptional regulator with XRE-family HTH domain
MDNVITEEEARKNIVANLACITTSRGIKQRQIAEAVKRPVMTINRMFRGESLPTVALTACVAECLGYSVEELIGDPSHIERREQLRARREKSLLPA